MYCTTSHRHTSLACLDQVLARVALQQPAQPRLLRGPQLERGGGRRAAAAAAARGLGARAHPGRQLQHGLLRGAGRQRAQHQQAGDLGPAAGDVIGHIHQIERNFCQKHTAKPVFFHKIKSFHRLPQHAKLLQGGGAP